MRFLLATGLLLSACFSPPKRSDSPDAVVAGADAGGDAVPGTGPIAKMSVGGGGFHACVINTQGDLWCWGRGTRGELGGAVVATSAPQRVNLPMPVAEVATGEGGSCAITSDRRMWCWGEEVPGQIPNPTPWEVTLPAPVEKIAVSQNTRCALLQNGALWCWGRNNHHQAGQPDSTMDQIVPAQVGGTTANVTTLTVGDNISCLLVGGVPRCFGTSYPTAPTTPTPTDRPLPDGRVANSLAGGCHQHTCATATDGTAWCVGSNTGRQLGNNSTIASDTWVQVAGFGPNNRAIDIAPGAEHTCARTDGAVWCWGRNRDGQTGQPITTTSVPTPARVSFYNGLNVTGLLVGCNHNCALADGRVTCFGSNQNTELGNGPGANSPTPVVAGVGTP